MIWAWGFFPVEFVLVDEMAVIELGDRLEGVLLPVGEMVGVPVVLLGEGVFTVGDLLVEKAERNKEHIQEIIKDFIKGTLHSCKISIVGNKDVSLFQDKRYPL